MRRRKALTVIIGVVAVAVLGSLAIVTLWPKAKVETVPPGHPRWLASDSLTVAERRGRWLTILRVSGHEEPVRLGVHRLDRGASTYAWDGVGTLYVICSRGPGWPGGQGAVRVYDAGKERYRVPWTLMHWQGRAIAPIAVLADGHLLALYRAPGAPTAPPPPAQESPPLAGIIAPLGESAERFDLLAKPTSVITRTLVSGDGTVVALTFTTGYGQTTARHRTALFAATDGSETASFDDFRIEALSRDGSLLVGRTPTSIGVIRDQAIIAERPNKSTPYLKLSGNGKYLAFGSRGPIEVAEAESLTPVFQYGVPLGYSIWGDYVAVSSTGRLAVVEYQELRKRRYRFRLAIHGPDGHLLAARAFGPMAQCPIAAPTWSADGSVLNYLDKSRRRLARLVP